LEETVKGPVLFTDSSHKYFL